MCHLDWQESDIAALDLFYHENLDGQGEDQFACADLDCHFPHTGDTQINAVFRLDTALRCAAQLRGVKNEPNKRVSVQQGHHIYSLKSSSGASKSSDIQ